MPGPKPDNTYRLVLFNAIEDPEPVRALICGVTGLHPTDANQWIARAPGIMRYPLAEGEIREILDGLYDLGIPAEAWRIDAIPNLHHPRTIHEAACLDEGLRITGLRGEPTHWVPWPAFELVAAGLVQQDEEERDITPPGWVRAASTGLNAMLRRPQLIARKERTIRLPREPVAEVVLVRRDPRLAFRIISTQMNYASLGDQLKGSSADNFPILLGQICDRATDAYLAPSTRALLEGKSPRDYTFPSSSDLLEYATLRLLWAWYRRDREREGEGGPPTASD